MGKITKEAAGEAGPSEAGGEDRKKKVRKIAFFHKSGTKKRNEYERN